MPRTLHVSLFLLACLVAPAQGQCSPDWLYEPGQGTGVLAGNVYSTTSWDPDGNGPQPPLLIIGGTFSFGAAGEHLHRSIVAWNGTDFLPLGAGFNGSVLALTVFNGQLIAGGSFTAPGAGTGSLRRIAAWDGSTWQQIGDGVGGTVNSVTVFNNQLHIGGDFDTINLSSPASDLARWDGAALQRLGAGTGGAFLPRAVTALAVFNNQLIVGGSFASIDSLNFKSIAAWNGAAFTALGPTGAVVQNGTDPGSVNALSVINNQLIAAGLFSSIGDVSASNVAAWNGTNWQPFGAGVASTRYAIGAYGDQILAGGIGSLKAWNGTTWEDFVQLSGGGFSATVRCFGSFGGDLIAGGSTMLGAIGPTTSLARFDGNAWNRFPSGPQNLYPVSNALVEWSNHIVAAGEFTTVGGVPANGIAAFDGQQWSALGDGFPPNSVRTLGDLNGQLIAGGTFRAGVSNSPATIIARWDGAAWQQFGSPPPTNQGGHADSSAIFKGNLVIAGSLPTTTSPTANRILMWDGAAWQSLGIGSLSTAIATNLIAWNGKLVTDLPMRTNAGVVINSLSQWDGTDWSAVGTQPLVFQRPVLGVFDGRLIVSGLTSAGGVSMNGIGSFDGSQWTPLGAGGGYTGAVLAMKAQSGRLIIAGNITAAGGQPASNIASWDGLSWSNMTGGANATVSRLGSLGHEFIANGLFTTAGGQTSQRWARWGCGCYANCDNSTAQPILNINDFQCFLNQFATGSSYANCDNSAAPPILNANDFQCFINNFAAGCS